MDKKYFQKITSINLESPNEKEEIQENGYIFKVLVEKENIIIISSKGLILIYNKINFSLKLSKNIIPQDYSSYDLKNFLKIEDDIFLISFGLIILFFKILLPEIKSIKYGYYFFYNMIKIKNDIFIYLEGDKLSDLPELKLIEFKVKTKEKDKNLEEDFEGEEIDYFILDSFYEIFQEYDGTHEEVYKYPSNI